MVEGCSAIIMAAGKGTRMKSSLPKVLHPLLGRTLLSHSMHAVMGLDPSEVVVVVRHDRDAVAAEASAVLPTAVIADQDDVPGTGRAVQCGLEGADDQGKPISGTVLVTSADVPLLETDTLRQLVEAHEKASAAVTMVTTLVEDPTGYGRVVRSDQNVEDVLAVVEHRDASPAQLEIREINAGIYAFDSKFLAEALNAVGQDNDQGEVYLTDVVGLASENGRRVQAFVLEDYWQAEGCNDRWQLAALRKELNRRICQKHCESGVTVVDPDTTSIDVEVIIDTDAVIQPFSSLLGATSVGSGASIGPNTTLIDCVVGAGAQVPSSYVRGQELAPRQDVRPFSVVTADTHATERESK